MKRGIWLLLLALLLLAAAWLWQSGKPGPNSRPPGIPDAPAPPAAPASSPASLPAGTTTLSLPVSDKPLSAEEIPGALEALIGSKAVSSFLQVDQFPRRLVATIDNLGRSHAPPALWPVHPTPGRFSVDGEPGGSSTIGLENATRYTPMVLLVETVDVGKAADLYVSLYPLLQKAYVELGYPNGRFNDRLLEVIDLLLATPEPEQPPKVELVDVKGPVASVRPWVRYEFSDPALEALSSGQKILIRVGIVNERRLKKRLSELRDEIVKRAQKR